MTYQLQQFIHLLFLSMDLLVLAFDLVLQALYLLPQFGRFRSLPQHRINLLHIVPKLTITCATTLPGREQSAGGRVDTG